MTFEGKKKKKKMISDHSWLKMSIYCFKVDALQIKLSWRTKTTPLIYLYGCVCIDCRSVHLFWFMFTPTFQNKPEETEFVKSHLDHGAASSAHGATQHCCTLCVHCMFIYSHKDLMRPLCFINDDLIFRQISTIVGSNNL